jgi:uncharacterized protein YfkK (UPF0435 family)
MNKYPETGRSVFVDLETPSKENVAHIVDEIKSRLNLVNEALIDPDDFELEKYDELLDLYRMIRKKGTLTPMEMEGILAELGELRKAKK